MEGRKNSKLRNKIISQFLIVVLVITLCGGYQPRKVEAKKESSTEIKVVKELANERTENSNTYLLSDGSKKTELFFSNIRYKENGELIDYDNEVVPLSNQDKQELREIAVDNVETYKYANKRSDCKVFFSEDIEDGVLLSHDKYLIKMSPIINDDIEENSSGEVESSSSEISDEEKNYVFSKKKDTNEIRYESKDIEYQYLAQENGVKENIILNSRPENNVFEYKIETKNLYLKQEENVKNLAVCDQKTNKIIGRIQPPFLRDAEGREDYNNINYELTKENGEIILKVIVNDSYFDNENLKYPIIIDPTMVWMFDYLSTAMVWSVDFMANSTMHNSLLTVWNQMISSYPYNSEQRVYLDTTNLLTGNALVGNGYSISDKYIESATMRLFERNYSVPYCAGTLQLRNATGSWSPDTITWNDQPGISNDIILSEEFVGTEGTLHELDITNWMQSIADGSQSNNGLVITCEMGGAALFYGPESSNYTRMSIDLVYREFEPYDDSVDLSVNYDDQSDKFQTTIEDKNELEEGVSVSGYKIFTRKDSGNRFHSEFTGENITETGEVNAANVNECIDVRACILYSNGTVKVSNIVTMEKREDEHSEESTSEPETNEPESTSEEETLIDRGYSFIPTTKDTDEDGLEDGYEIWDFKTLWNTETSNSTQENPEYDLDTDDDGFPDSYEVFTLGTDPAVANESGANSDGDNWTDLREYQEGTDPWIKDSDFDGINDSGDATPRKTNDYTRQTRAAEAVVHKGLYDKQYSETIDGVTYTYITNVYRGDLKKIEADYGDSSLNKTMKYFYDERGNNTAIIEAYDEIYDPNHTQTICITYTYDENNNVIFICDQKTRYTMTYGTDNQMQSLKVGNQTLMTYGNTELINNAGTDGNVSQIEIGGIIDKIEDSETYGNGQVVKSVTTTYKVAENDTTSTASKTEILYGNDTDPTYVTYFNSEGEIKKLEDYSADSNNPVEWNYTYTENGSSLTRSDGFTKSIQTSEDESTGVSTTVTSYGIKDLKNQNKTYTSTVASQTETETNAEGEEIEVQVVNQTLHNNDVVRIETEDDASEEKIHSNAYDCNVIKSIYEKSDNTHSSFDVNIYGTTDDKDFDYTYDLAGNITQIKINNVVKYEYGYDAHGRLTDEKDYIDLKEYVYEYNTNGNVYGKITYTINSSGTRTNNGNTVLYTYDNSDWPDQLTTYNGETITYDNSGNPIDYVGGLSFTWNRGRQLSSVTLADDSTVSYQYNENGLRTYKDTPDTTTVYDWDGSTLIRETVTYKSTNQKTDVWYLYNPNGEAIGFEYSYLNYAGSLITARIYYEKNFQGDVIGLLDARGAQIASYTYDAWGNITSNTYVEGNEIPYELNHIGYRGYYRDQETGFYYLQSRYYDAKVSRFINADDIEYLGSDEKIYKNNIYLYCEGNPIKYADKTGNSVIGVVLAYLGIKSYTRYKRIYKKNSIGKIISGNYPHTKYLKKDLKKLLQMVAGECLGSHCSVEAVACAYVAMNRINKYRWKNWDLDDILTPEEFYGIKNKQGKKMKKYIEENRGLDNYERKYFDEIIKYVIKAYIKDIADPTNGAVYFSDVPQSYSGKEVIIRSDHNICKFKKEKVHKLEHRFFKYK
ncbi:MAG: DNRLRE domain-containing protein [Eubacterium sp.]|nr:DNRLRE domain-containing protein [Eubacterium sp.]